MEADTRDNVGLVIGTDEATPTEFWYAVPDDSYGQLDDVVVVERRLPSVEVPVKLYGQVVQVRVREDGARFDDDVFDESRPTDISEAAKVLVTRTEPEVPVPPMPRSPVNIARGEERDIALFFDKMEGAKLPVGLTRDNQPLYVNFNFMNGISGAHVNISGISGVATKTSFGTWLLHSIFNSGVLADVGSNTQALVFNVKGEDLLWLDHANTKLATDYPDHPELYKLAGLPATPFKSVGMWAPPAKTGKFAANTGSRREGVVPYFWTIADFCKEQMLPFLFADAQDDRNQYSTTVATVTARLAKHGVVKPTATGGVIIDGQTLSTFHEFVDYISEQVEEDEAGVWRGRAIGQGTAQAFVRRFASAAEPLKSLIRGDQPDPGRYRIDLSKSQVSVVDIHRLNDRAQRFVVGVMLRTMFDDKEDSGKREPLSFIVLDELNKYAPAQGTSPIKEILLDVAERGRSLGIILIGAQQTASEVERRIVSNAAIRVVGRLDGAEAARQEYAWLPTEQRQRSLILQSGTMLVGQPQSPVPMPVRFPFPAWATREEEAGQSLSAGGGDVPEDVFDGIAGGTDGEVPEGFSGHYDEKGDPVPF